MLFSFQSNQTLHFKIIYVINVLRIFIMSNSNQIWSPLPLCRPDCLSWPMMNSLSAHWSSPAMTLAGHKPTLSTNVMPPLPSVRLYSPYLESRLSTVPVVLKVKHTLMTSTCTLDWISVNCCWSFLSVWMADHWFLGTRQIQALLKHLSIDFYLPRAILNVTPEAEIGAFSII